MQANCRVPGAIQALVIETKLRRIHDPIQKLSYLRHMSSRNSKPGTRYISACLRTVLLILMILGVRIQTVTDANASLPREKQKSAKSLLQNQPIVLQSVWIVEKAKDYEVYSNSLRIENRYLSPNQARSYVTFRPGQPPDKTSEWSSKPAGIIFHTSESVQAPLVPDQNDNLTRIGRGLLEYVSRHHAYHFVIDRFGRIFRIVPETDSANHAGYSVWADQEKVYINLNHSFLGVSFEAHTGNIDDGCYLTAAQVHSGRLLVQMLVSKYNIPFRNCITHAQVSVNPDSMIIGFHTDGSGDFPFRELGLPDNYSLPLPSISLFGFDYDPSVLMSTGFRMWRGLLSADEQLRREAESHKIPLGQYKQKLRERYRISMATLKTMGVIKEN
jgi:hypothetical protein